MFSWKIYLRLLLINFALLSNAAVFNAAAEGGTKVNFSGRVVDPPACNFNNNQMIETPFGNVKKEDADGKTIVKEVNYNLTCTGGDESKSLKIMIVGTTTSSKSVLATSISGLGIQLYNSTNDPINMPMSLNTWQFLPYPANKFRLTASPIIEEGKNMVGSDFTASATMLVLFQ